MASLSTYNPSLILSANQALLGQVSGSLRSVQAEYRESGINLYCYFDGEISEDDREAMSLVSTYVAADFPDHMVNEHCIRVDAPESVPLVEERHPVFERMEKGK
jgi:hypothetical protein